LLPAGISSKLRINSKYRVISCASISDEPVVVSGLKFHGFMTECTRSALLRTHTENLANAVYSGTIVDGVM
jgi:hypothetical protein